MSAELKIAAHRMVAGASLHQGVDNIDLPAACQRACRYGGAEPLKNLREVRVASTLPSALL
jgi:hypothetical protein